MLIRDYPRIIASLIIHIRYSVFENRTIRKLHLYSIIHDYSLFVGALATLWHPSKASLCNQSPPLLSMKGLNFDQFHFVQVNQEVGSLVLDQQVLMNGYLYFGSVGVK